MDITTSMAAVAVTDLATATDFYEQLLGCPPDQRPMPSLAQWDLPNGSALQVVEDGDRAGTSMATLVTSDLDGTIARASGRGVTFGDVIDGVLSRLVQVSDPDGNLVTVVEAPAGS